MTSPCWMLEEYNARLSTNGLHAKLDLLEPARGLANVRLSGVVLEDAGLLGVEIPSHRPSNAGGLVERHVRGPELVVAYKESEAWPVHVDLTWRVVEASECLAAIDLVVSVFTEQLDSQPALVVQSAAPTAEKPIGIDQTVDPGCLVFRLPDCDVSYVEMVHPADRGRDELRRGESAGGESSQAVACLSHQLFLAPLEKGVLLRSRVRGLFVPRVGDLELAAECYKKFITAAPPLAD